MPIGVSPPMTYKVKGMKAKSHGASGYTSGSISNNSAGSSPMSDPMAASSTNRGGNLGRPYKSRGNSLGTPTNRRQQKRSGGFASQDQGNFVGVRHGAASLISAATFGTVGTFPGPTGALYSPPHGAAPSPQSRAPSSGSSNHTPVQSNTSSLEAFQRPTGSRGSSPWHLPSPVSEVSTASDRVNSSHHSSDSYDSRTGQHQYDFGELLSDPSQCDTPGTRSTQQSDSDYATPRSGKSGQQRATVDESGQSQLWEQIKTQITRMELSKDHLHRRRESPGDASQVGNFRQAMGMTQGGPVVPPKAMPATSVPVYGFNPVSRPSDGGSHGVRPNAAGARPRGSGGAQASSSGPAPKSQQHGGSLRKHHGLGDHKK